MGKNERFSQLRVEGEFKKHSSQIFLDKVDLYELYLASIFGNSNWRPGQAIQVGDFKLAQHPLAQQSMRHLQYNNNRYDFKREGY